MREHQIVITLKPEQFLEVQKLARASNAKSMGIFVRQRLLAALGIEGNLDAVAGAESVDLAPLSAELKRLHSELKTFVVESLSMYSVDAIDPSQFDEAVVERPIPPEPLGILVSEPHQPPDDYLEHTAEKTFAISPRLGALGEDISGHDVAGKDAYSAPAAVLPVGNNAAAAVSEPITVEQVALYEPAPVDPPQQAVKQPAQQPTQQPATLVVKTEAHTRLEFHRYNQNAAKDLMDVPFSNDDERARQVRERFEDSGVSAAGRDARLRSDYADDFEDDAGNDWQNQRRAPEPPEIEEPPAALFDDPLERLLGKTDMAALGRMRSQSEYNSDEEDDEEDYEDFEQEGQDVFDVPLSIAERNRQLAAQSELPADDFQTAPEPEFIPEQLATPDQSADFWQPEAISDEPFINEPEQSIIQNAEDNLPDAASVDPLAGNTVPNTLPENHAPVPPEGSKPATGRPLGYPPVSGNPPPKRRQV